MRHIGVSNFDVAQLRRAQAIAPVETLQPPYSLLERAVEDEVLPFAQSEGIGVIVYSPMASGLLTGAMTAERIAAMPDDDWRKHDPRFQEPQLSRHLALVARLQEVAERHDTTAGAIAVAWTLHHPAVHGSIVGFRRPDQVAGAGASPANVELTDEDLATIVGMTRRRVRAPAAGGHLRHASAPRSALAAGRVRRAPARRGPHPARRRLHHGRRAGRPARARAAGRGGARQRRRPRGPRAAALGPCGGGRGGADRHGPRRGAADGRLARLRRRFASAEADAVVFGHSHIPLHERDPATGFQIFNPGSPTDRRRQPTHTMGQARISEDGAVSFELIDLG